MLCVKTTLRIYRRIRSRVAAQVAAYQTLVRQLENTRRKGNHSTPPLKTLNLISFDNLVWRWIVIS